jgi:hypothetical protein
MGNIRVAVCLRPGVTYCVAVTTFENDIFFSRKLLHHKCELQQAACISEGRTFRKYFEKINFIYTPEHENRFCWKAL